jgi:hypothetical protein
MATDTDTTANPFIEHPAKRNTDRRAGGVQWEFTFPNGYGASVINDGYGREAGLWELAVLCNGALCYDTPITGDVLGWLTVEEVREHLRSIAELAPAVQS